MAKKNQANEDVSGVAMGGCVLVGLAGGLALNNVGVGVLLGTGVGLLVMAAIKSRS